ncbi:lectin family integral membrane protein [Sporothrix schenckii 1099-18]|uniref:L-type lectin-like domain-containing protein n=2 Tax=Sporothrix schenckii TaxID=29908 RepID=U7Q4H7_SPOS1|nr:lectin family integral membrane protein [Sporothrix schenckii 1099-18]ERT01616.1 hypothetical protein HMPREF1624_02867 [Sporothrix schenckii ATCC 58251]KJR88844.1 lectin family integral membrane protein [Sporothrix schenckii 1099-18]
MRISSASLAWSWSLLAGAAHAQFLVSELSFGYTNRIAPEHSRSIPHFELQGNPYQPEILSNKVVLTPAAPAPGGQRGAVWAEHTLDYSRWLADVDFRVSGPERGGGNLNIWLVKDGPTNVGTSSVYTVGKFEGLVLVLDASGVRGGGSLRGYLNDGTKEYKALTGIDSLAFAHCDYPFRNLGRPAQVKIQQTDRLFSVELDGHLCFSSEDVVIPTGYRFGVTAASADTPDSAEIFKLVVMHDNNDYTFKSDEHQQQQHEFHDEHDQYTKQKPVAGGEGHPPVRISRGGMVEDTPEARNYERDNIPDADANTITSSKAQFADLHNRLQSVNHHLSTIFRQVATSDQVGEKRHEEVSVQLGQLKGLLTKLDRLDMIEDKLEQMERDMKTLHSELRQSVANAESSVRQHVAGRLEGHHDRLAETLRHPGHGRLIFVIVAGQLLLAGAYVFYKRRKASSPKKYL